MNTNIKIFCGVIVLLVIGLIGTAMLRGTATPSVADGQYDGFAQCLKDKGATFYGAFWCPHCQATKKMFGSSSKLLPYVECSTADAQGQTQACIDKKITGYPTWEFADGTRLNGETTFQALADKTGCALPAGTSGAAAAPSVNAGATSTVPVTAVPAATSSTTTTNTKTNAQGTASPWSNPPAKTSPIPPAKTQ